jgi:hypothetical protein
VGLRAQDVSPARAVADRMAEAARSWLDQLDQGSAGSRSERCRPATRPMPSGCAGSTRHDHGGLTMHQQRPAQQRAAMRLVASGLSAPAYVTVATVMGMENVLDQAEGFVARFDRERGRDPGLYYLRVFGEPGGAAPWAGGSAGTTSR